MSIKIAVVGATGFVGAKIVSEALDNGFEVVGINHSGSTKGINSRNMNKLEMKKCDALNKDALVSAFKGCQVVIHSGAPPKDSNVEQAIEYQQKLTTAILDAAVECKVERVLAVGGAGTLITNGTRNMDGPNFPAAFEVAAKATERVLKIMLEEKRIPTTVLCPSLDLFEGDRTGKYRTSNDETIFSKDGTSRISTSDFAVAMIDEVKNKQHIHGRFTAGY